MGRTLGCLTGRHLYCLCCCCFKIKKKNEPFLKSLLTLLQYCFCFMSLLWFFGLEARGILAPPPGIKPVSPCIGRQSLNRWTAREVPHVLSLTWKIREDREMGQRHCRAEKTPILGDFRLLKALCVLTRVGGYQTWDFSLVLTSCAQEASC